jgi:hypothetical protein
LLVCLEKPNGRQDRRTSSFKRILPILVCGKQIHPDPPVYSVRIGIRYRAVGVVDKDVIVWYWIGTHAEYDKLIDQL